MKSFNEDAYQQKYIQSLFVSYSQDIQPPSKDLEERLYNAVKKTIEQDKKRKKYVQASVVATVVFSVVIFNLVFFKFYA